MKLYNEKIFVAEYCLRYETRPTIIHEWTRARYDRAKREVRHNSYLVRVSLERANEILRAEDKEYSRKAYDKAIMNKYNVGANYRQNRWFMEQVRPTIG